MDYIVRLACHAKSCVKTEVGSKALKAKPRIYTFFSSDVY